MKTFTGFAFLCVVLAGCTRPPPDIRQRHVDRDLVIAAFRLEREQVVRLLELGADVNARLGDSASTVFIDRWELSCPSDYDNWTPLLAALNSSRYPDPYRMTENTSAARERAIRERGRIPNTVITQRDLRRIDIVRLLLHAGADINADDGHGGSPLYIAIDKRLDDIAFLLLDGSPNVRTKTTTWFEPLTAGYTPLHRATYNPRLLTALLERGADVNAITAQGETPLTIALESGHTNAAIILLHAGAVLPKHTDAMKSLFWRVMDLATPRDADQAKAEESFRLMLSAGVDPNTECGQDGISIKCLDLVIFFIEEPAPFVKMLVDAGANVNVSGREGMTPLHDAAMQGKAAAARVLLAAGADACATNNVGETPFQVVPTLPDDVESEAITDEERQVIENWRATAVLLKKAEEQQRAANHPAPGKPAPGR